MTEPLPGPWWLTPWTQLLRNHPSGTDVGIDAPRLTIAAMLLAAHGSPHLSSLDDVRIELDRLDAAVARFDLVASSPRGSIARLISVCAEPSGKGFGLDGDQQNYHDPANSFLPDIRRRRKGLPIGLAVLWLHVAERLGVPAYGVGMPGHFLIGCGTDSADSMYIDCFHGGQLLTVTECAVLYDRLFSGRPHAPFHQEYLAPVSDEAMLTRMIANLKQHAARRRDLTTLADLSRLRWFLPMASLDEGRELVRLCVALGAANEAKYWLNSVTERFGPLYPEAQRVSDTAAVYAAHN